MDPTIAGTSVQILPDSAYASGKMLAALARTAHTPLIEPWPLNSVVQSGFTLDDFTVSEAAGTVPARMASPGKSPPKRRATFDAACTECPFKERWVVPPDEHTLVLHADALHYEHRQRAADPTFQEYYRTRRPMVERSMAHPRQPPPSPSRHHTEQRLATPTGRGTKPATPASSRTDRERWVVGSRINHRSDPASPTTG
jgi:hypothetical protein